MMTTTKRSRPHSSKPISRFEYARKRIKNSEEIDRLSSLPDSVIHHILSLLDAKQAVRTSILSKKWKFQWAHVPSYIFKPSGDRKLFNLNRPMFKVNGITLPSMLKMFFGYALSCNSEELNVRNIVRIDNNQNLVDRLSSLPDKLIRHILSLVDTKYAVRTQILSKRWIGQWRHIHNHSSFSCRAGFKAFVHRVLVHREGKDLVKIKAFCGDTVGSKQTLMCPLFTHAQDYKVTEIETDAIAYFPPMYEDNNNNSTDDFDHSDHCFNLQHMNTLRISATSFYSELDLLSADCFIPLKNLHIVDCSVHSKILDLSVTFMDNVTISNLRFCKKVYVMAGSIKVFNWEGESPCWFHFYNSYPQKMNIYISSSPDACGTTEWFAEIGNMIESCNLSSVKVVLKTFKGIFILHYRCCGDDKSETKIVKFNEVSSCALYYF